MVASRKWSLTELRREAAGCTRCPLYENATQTVFGEGRAGGLVLVGEQPGDQEDRAGRPFVGPAELRNGVPALVTIHPSAVLRAGDDRKARRGELLDDLELAKQTLAATEWGRVSRALPTGIAKL